MQGPIQCVNSGTYVLSIGSTPTLEGERESRTSPCANDASRGGESLCVRANIDDTVCNTKHVTRVHVVIDSCVKHIRFI